MSHLWQQPYVNVFKHFNLQSWKKSSKEGDVTSIMDKTVKGSVWRISGSIPAGNYIQLPNTSTQSLGLTGRYLYLLFRPVPSKYFVVHVDVATQDGLIVRISFSNLFKEFKSTSTWLQFPFICHAAKGTVTGRTRTRSTDNSGPAPLTTHWTVLCLDLHYILSMYINRRYSYCKSIKLCSSMFVKNIFTADTQFEPGITFEEVKRTGVTALGMAPIPREMAFPLGKCQDWHDNYDYIVFPSDTTKKPFDSIQRCDPSKIKAGPPGVVTSPKRVVSKTVHVSKTVIPEKSCIISAATNKPKRKLLHRLHTTFNMEAAPGLPAGEDEFMESPQMTRAAKQRAYMRKKKARLGSNACKLLMLQQRRATKMAAQDKYTGEERERRRIHKAQRDRRAYVNKLFKEGKPLPAPEKYSSYWQVRLGVPAAGSPQDADVKLTLPTHTAAKTDGAVMGDPPESFQNLLHILNTTNTFNRDVAPGLLAGEDEFLERSQMTKADKQWAYRRKQKELLGDKPYQVLMAQKRRAAKMAAQAKFSGIELERRRKQKAKRDRRAYVNRLFKAGKPIPAPEKYSPYWQVHLGLPAEDLPQDIDE